MLEYKLDELGWERFEQLVQALLKARLGLGIEAWGGSGDHGRDAYFRGRLKYPSNEPSEGTFLFQCKFVEAANAAGAKPARRIIDAVRKECQRIKARFGAGEKGNSQTCYVLFTNAVLTPGTRSKIETQLKTSIPHGSIHVHDGGDICQWLRLSPELLQSFPQLRGFATPKATPEQIPTFLLSKYFVARSKPTCDLLARVLPRNDTSKAGLITVVCGPGGSGKSTLTADLASGPGVRARFVDGILWVTLGQQPNLVSLLLGWVQSLGDYDFRSTDPPAIASHLRSLLQGRATLLVVDDAWDVSDVRPFLVGGPDSHLIVTTRDALIARAIDAHRYDLGMMTIEESVRLLSQRLGHQLEGTAYDHALSLAETVGHLPLALELAASAIDDGISWDELLSDLNLEVARLEALEPPDVHEIDDWNIQKRLSVKASLNLSLARLNNEMRIRFAWLGVLAEHARLTPAVTGILWDTDERTARDALRYFHSKSLLLPDTPGTEFVYRIHDLFHDLARRLVVGPTTPARSGDLPGMGLTLEVAHQRVLERYKFRTWNGLWHTVPDDGYIHDHLAWHFQNALQHDHLHSLLCEETGQGKNGWFSTRFAQGKEAEYVEDIKRAWESLLHEQDSEVGASFDQHILYTAMITAINSNSQLLPCSLPAALVKVGIWTGARALQASLRIPDSSQRAVTLATLANLLNDSERQVAIQAAIHCAFNAHDQLLNRDSGSLHHCLVDVVRRICPEKFPQSGPSQHLFDYTRTLSQLASDLRELGFRRQAIEIAKRATSWQLIETLTALAPGSTPDELEQLVEIAKRVDRLPSEKMRIISTLARYLPESKLESLIREAIVYDPQFRRDYYISGLIQLASSLSGALKRIVIRRILDDLFDNFENEREAVGALMQIVGSLTESEVQEAFAFFRRFTKPETRLQAMIALLPYLPDAFRPDVLTEALGIAETLQQEAVTLTVIRTLSPFLSVVQLQRAFDMARAMRDQDSQAWLSVGLFSSLAWFGYFEIAASVARSIASPNRRAKALLQILPFLSETILRNNIASEILDAATSSNGNDEPEWRGRSDILIELIPHLPTSLESKFLETIPKIEGEYGQDTANSEFVMHCIANSEHELAVQAAKRIGDREKRAQALGLVSQFLSGAEKEQIQREVLETGRQKREFAKMVALLAPHLTPKLLQVCLAESRTIDYAIDRASALSSLLSRLQKDDREAVVAEALAATRDAWDIGKKVQLLVSLIPFVADSQKENLLLEANEALNKEDSIGFGKDSSPDLLPFLHHAPSIRDDLWAKNIASATQHALHLAYGSSVFATFTRDREHVYAILPEPIRGAFFADLFMHFNGLAPGIERNHCLMWLASQYHNVGMTAQAIDVGDQISEARIRCRLLLSVRFEDASVADQDKPQYTTAVAANLELIDDDDERSELGFEFVRRFTLAGWWNEAHALALSLLNEDYRIRGLALILKDLPTDFANMRDSLIENICSCPAGALRTLSLADLGPAIRHSDHDSKLAEDIDQLLDDDSKALANLLRSPTALQHTQTQWRAECLLRLFPRPAQTATIFALYWGDPYERWRPMFASPLHLPTANEGHAQDARAVALNVVTQQLVKAEEGELASKLAATITVRPHQLCTLAGLYSFFSAEKRKEFVSEVTQFCHTSFTEQTVATYASYARTTIFDPLWPPGSPMTAIPYSEALECILQSIAKCEYSAALSIIEALPIGSLKPYCTSAIEEFLPPDIVAANSLKLRLPWALDPRISRFSHHLMSLDSQIESEASSGDGGDKTKPNCAEEPESAPHQESLESYRAKLIAAQTKSDPKDRAWALLRTLDDCPPEEAHGVCEEVRTLVEQIESPKDRANISIQLLPFSSSDDRANLFSQALSVFETQIATRDFQFSNEMALAFANAAPYLNQRQLREATEAAKQIHDDRQRLQTLDQLIQFAEEPLLREIVEWTPAGGDDEEANWALAEFIRRLGHRHPTEALLQARQLNSPDIRVWALVGVFGNLAEADRPQLLEELLTDISNISYALNRCNALAAVAPYLSISQIDRAFAIASREHQTPGWIWIPHSALADRLAALGDCSEALRFILSLEDDGIKSSCLAKIAPRFDREALFEVLRQTEAMHESRRADVLKGIIPQLANLGEVTTALNLVRSMVGNKKARADAIKGLAPYLSPLQLDEITELAHTITQSASAIAELAYHLCRNGNGNKAIAIINTIGQNEGYSNYHTPEYPIEGFADLLSRLPQAQRDSLFPAVLDALEDAKGFPTPFLMTTDWVASDWFVRVGPMVPPAHVAQALTQARHLAERGACCQALLGLLPAVDQEQRSLILNEAFDILKNCEEKCVPLLLLEFAKHADGATMEWIVQRAYQLVDDDRKAHTLAGLIQFTANAEEKRSLLRDALHAALNLGTSRTVLIDWGNSGDAGQAGTLRELNENALQLSVEDACVFLKTALLRLSAGSRKEGFLALRVFAPLIEKIGGTTAIINTIDAIRRVQQWWP